MKLIIFTQFCENYGAHDWDGKGECPQYWRSKGGSEYSIPVKLDFILANGQAGLAKLVETARPQIEHSNEYSEEYIINWELFEDAELTPGQKLYADDGEMIPDYANPKVLAIK